MTAPGLSPPSRDPSLSGDDFSQQFRHQVNRLGNLVRGLEMITDFLYEPGDGPAPGKDSDGDGATDAEVAIAVVRSACRCRGSSTG